MVILDGFAVIVPALAVAGPVAKKVRLPGSGGTGPVSEPETNAPVPV